MDYRDLSPATSIFFFFGLKYRLLILRALKDLKRFGLINRNCYLSLQFHNLRSKNQFFFAQRLTLKKLNLTDLSYVVVVHFKDLIRPVDSSVR